MKEVVIYTDGGSRGNPGISGAGWVIVIDNEKPQSRFKYLGMATNNEAEYQAVVLALQHLESMDIADIGKITIKTDSNLINGHFNLHWKMKPKFVDFYAEIVRIISKAKIYKIEHIKRSSDAFNVLADKLANRAMDMGERANDT